MIPNTLLLTKRHHIWTKFKVPGDLRPLLESRLKVVISIYPYCILLDFKKLSNWFTFFQVSAY